MMISGAIQAIANMISTGLKRFVKTPEEKRQHLINKENARLVKNKEKSRRYLKKRLRSRR